MLIWGRSWLELLPVLKNATAAMTIASTTPQPIMQDLQ